MKINKKNFCRPYFFLLAVSGGFASGVYAQGTQKRAVLHYFISKIIDDSDFWTQLIDGTKSGSAGIRRGTVRPCAGG